MTIFAEPTVTLCGEKAENKYAICCVDVTQHEGRPHEFIDANEVYRRLEHTFTPCRWAKQP